MRQPHGQNFLIDGNIARKIVSAAGISSSDRILEIGPGKGALSGLIAPLAKEFKAVEIDRELYQGLAVKMAGFRNTGVLLADFLQYPFASETGPLKIIANLPYNVSTAIIERILPENNWTTAVLMVQKEVGERIAASAGHREYGYFSAFCSYYARIEKLFTVGPGCFSPKPKVDSLVIGMTNLFREKLSDDFVNFLKAAFSQRRKTAVNSIASVLSIPKDAVLKAFELSHLDLLLRPEKIALADFMKLYGCLSGRPVSIDYKLPK